MTIGWGRRGGGPRWGRLLAVGMLGVLGLMTALPPAGVGGAPNYTAADSLLAGGAATTWPTIGRNYKHQGWSPFAGPASPQTRGLAEIRKQDGSDPSKEYGTYLRSAYLGEDGLLFAGGGMTGFFEVSWNGPTLRRSDEFYTCCGGETWVEDLTIGRDNAIYVKNEGGYIRKVVKVNGAWSDSSGGGWRRFHGFLHAPPALYPYEGATGGVAVLIISPDGYIAALDSGTGCKPLPIGCDTSEPWLWRYRYQPGSGNKESVREKGFTWNSQGHIYFPWGHTLFVISPAGVELDRIPLGGAVTSGPVLADDGLLYMTGNGQFFQVNPTTRVARVFNMGSSPLDSTFFPRTAKERWPALSPNSGNPNAYTVYYTASNGALYAMNPVTWQPRWVHRYDGPAGDFDGIKSDPLVDINGAIYFYGADQHLYAINPDGSRRWKFGSSTATDRFYPGTQLVLDGGSTIYAASTGSGRNVVWAVGPGGSTSPTATPTPTNTPGVPGPEPPTPTPTRTPTATPNPLGERIAVVDADDLPPVTAAANSLAGNLIDNKTWTRWETAWNTPSQLTARLDLGSSQSIGAIRVLIGSPGYARDISFRVAANPAGPWTDISGAVNVDFGTAGGWQTLPVSAAGRYLQIQILNTGGQGKLGGFGGVELYRP